MIRFASTTRGAVEPGSSPADERATTVCRLQPGAPSHQVNPQPPRPVQRGLLQSLAHRPCPRCEGRKHHLRRGRQDEIPRPSPSRSTQIERGLAEVFVGAHRRPRRSHRWCHARPTQPRAQVRSHLGGGLTAGPAPTTTRSKLLLTPHLPGPHRMNSAEPTSAASRPRDNRTGSASPRRMTPLPHSPCQGDVLPRDKSERGQHLAGYGRQSRRSPRSPTCCTSNHQLQRLGNEQEQHGSGSC